jgi:hypothetical protein
LIHRESYAEFNLDRVQVTSVRQRRRFSSAENKLGGLPGLVPLLLMLRGCASVQVYLGMKVYLDRTPRLIPESQPAEKAGDWAGREAASVGVGTQPDGKVLQTRERAGARQYEPPATLDADVALARRIRVAGDEIYQRLASNGFEAEFLKHHRPPAAHYRLTNPGIHFYAEFLTPLVGSISEDEIHGKMLP